MNDNIGAEEGGIQGERGRRGDSTAHKLLQAGLREEA
jgi:hypothetical protein